LKYATNMKGTWSKQMVASVGEFLASRPSIAVTDQKIHIVFADQEGFALRHAMYGVERTAVTLTATSQQRGLHREQKVSVKEGIVSGSVVERWITEDLDHVGNTNCAMALDGSGNLQVAFRGSGGFSCGTRSRDSWTTSVVDPKQGGHNAIAVDKTGKIHLSYRDMESGALKYAWSK